MCEQNEFTRLELIIGEEKVKLLNQKHVAVFGLGGVGGFAVEALARSAIGKLTIIDYDKVDITNINRQIIADRSTLGQYKTDLFEQRLKRINPALTVNKINRMYTEQTKEEFFDNYDYIVDAIDMVKSKISLIKTAYDKNIPIISSMGMGNRLDPSMIQITTINKTFNCRLAKVIRSELKKLAITDLKCVFSSEDVKITKKVLNNNKMVNGSSAFVPSVAGLNIASHIIREFIK